MVRTVKASVAGSKSANTFLIAKFELGLPERVDKRPFT
jgi:hypothetical protein